MYSPNLPHTGAVHVLGGFSLVVAMSVLIHPSILSLSHAIFFKASRWPSDHMISSRPVIGQPPPTPPPKKKLN